MSEEPQAKKEAKEFARRVIEGSFKQPIDDEELDVVADKVMQAIPRTDD